MTTITTTIFTTMLRRRIALDGASYRAKPQLSFNRARAGRNATVVIPPGMQSGARVGLVYLVGTTAGGTSHAGRAILVLISRARLRRRVSAGLCDIFAGRSERSPKEGCQPVPRQLKRSIGELLQETLTQHPSLPRLWAACATFFSPCLWCCHPRPILCFRGRCLPHHLRSQLAYLE